MALDRRKITMRSISLAPNGDVLTHEATDYVDVDHIAEYVALAQDAWQVVLIGDETDHGPGGEDGEYVIPAAIIAEENTQ